MPYTLRLLTDEARTLVVGALRAEAAKRTRVAQGAALHVADDRAAKRDVRSASVRVTALLAEAGRLDQLANDLAAAPDVALVETQAGNATVTVEAPATTTAPVEDTPAEDTTDGLSPAAHAAMAQAEEFADEYLADPDGTDVDTQALSEDEPTADDVVEVLR